MWLGNRHASCYISRGIVICVGTLVFSWHLASSPWPGDVLVHDDNRWPAHLVFACDGPPDRLKTLLTPELIADLRELNAGVALATEDFSFERAQIVRELNNAGIPTVAVIVLDSAHGFYVNGNNAAATANRFAEFDRWTTANGLRWEAVGLDIEPSPNDWALINTHRVRFILTIVGRALESNDRVYGKRQVYSELIGRMQSRGYYVQTYQLPLIVNERRARSTLLEKVLGLVDTRGNEEVLMLYTSFNQAAGTAIIWEYGPETQAIAIGSTA
jgi:hypothetical protein